MANKWSDKVAFAQAIKAKHPQYSDLPDNILADKMLTKFPQYAQDIGGGENPVPSFDIAGVPGGAHPTVSTSPTDPENKVPAFLASMGNTAAFSLPQTLMNMAEKSGLLKTGWPEPTPAQKAAYTGGEIAGMVVPFGGPSKVAEMATTKMLGPATSAIGKVFVRGGINAGLTQAAGVPNEIAESGDITKFDPLASAERVVGATAVGSLLSGFGKIFGNTFKSLENLGNEKKFYDSIRNDAYTARGEMINKYGDKIDELVQGNPSAITTIKQTLDDAIDMAKDNSKLASALKKSKVFKNVNKKDGIASVAEVQQLINELSSTLPASAKAEGVARSIKELDRPLDSVVKELRLQMGTAFPEMTAMRQEYGDFIRPYNFIKGKLKEGSLGPMLKGASETGMGDADIRYAVSQVLPEDVVTQMGGYNKAYRILKGLNLLGGVALPTGRGVGKVSGAISPLVPEATTGGKVGAISLIDMLNKLRGEKK